MNKTWCLSSRQIEIVCFQTRVLPVAFYNTQIPFIIPYLLGGEPVQTSETEKLLGVHVSKTLTFEATLKKKCNSLLAYTKVIQDKTVPLCPNLFYNAYILPRLHYGCSNMGQRAYGYSN